MATRLFLPSSGSPAVTPSSWNFGAQITSPLTLPGSRSQSNTALTDLTGATGTTNPTHRGMARYVFGPLSAQTITGSITGQIRFDENNAGANATFAIAAKIITPAGADRAVLLAATASDSTATPPEFSTALRTRVPRDAAETNPINLTSQAATAGDYLVVEIGFRSATGTSRNITARIGDPTGSQLSSGDTTTDTNDFCPWIEFSADIEFASTTQDLTVAFNGVAAVAPAPSYRSSVSAAMAGTSAAVSPAAFITSLSVAFDGVSSVSATIAERKKIFGHYMGSFAAGTGAIQYHATLGLEELGCPVNVRNDKTLLAAWAATTFGGTYRNFALAPQDSGRTLAESAEIEVKRAIRIGMDGFTFDAWAGGLSARNLLDAMFTVCETQNLPFELTISMDSSVMNGTDADLVGYAGDTFEKTLRWLLDRHGASSKLARRDGKVMIMGYQSIWPGIKGIWDYVQATYPGYTQGQQEAEVNSLRMTQQGWALVADRYDQMAASIGQDIYWQFDMYAFFEGTGFTPTTTQWTNAAAYLATRFPALGAFTFEGSTEYYQAAAVAGGAEWSPPAKLQFENYGYYQTASPGLDWMRSDWVEMNQPGSTLVQFITWNDYHENTNLSPGYNTRYAYYDLTGEYIKAWKAGGVPLSSTIDKVYIFSHKYAHNTPMYPFTALTRADNEIEVVTILPTTAKVRCPGRLTTLGESVWDAPAGYSYKRFPLTVGPVSVEWSRDNFVADINTLVLPDPVSDRPFRQDTGKVAICNREQYHWDLDFPSIPTMFVYSEYADSDGDGIPNWWEMFWFGTWGITSTQGVAAPGADPNGTGRTNLDHFLMMSDPYNPAPPDGGVDSTFGCGIFGALGFGGSASDPSDVGSLQVGFDGSSGVSAAPSSLTNISSAFVGSSDSSATLTFDASGATDGSTLGAVMFGASCFGGSSANLNVNTGGSVSLSVAIDGTSTATASTSHLTGLSAAVAGTSTASAATSHLTKISVAIAGTSTASASRSLLTKISAAIAGTSTVSPAPRFTVGLVTAIEGLSSVSTAITVDSSVNLVAAFGGVSAVSAQPAFRHTLGVAFAGVSSASASASQSVAISATLSGTSAVALAPTFAVSLVAGIDGVGALTAAPYTGAEFIWVNTYPVSVQPGIGRVVIEQQDSIVRINPSVSEALVQEEGSFVTIQGS